MGKTSYDMINDARKDVARIVKRSARIAAIALKDRTEAEVRAAFDLPAKDAPKWADLVQKVTAASARSETEQPATINQNLNVVMVGRDSSVSAWKARVEDAKPKKQEAIEAVVVDKDEKPGA